jgi:hypothetical protein
VLEGSLVLNALSTTLIELGGPTPGDGSGFHDQVRSAIDRQGRSGGMPWIGRTRRSAKLSYDLGLTKHPALPNPPEK